MSAVLDLLDRWDGLSKGQSPTTEAVREALAQDHAAMHALHKPSIDHGPNFDAYCIGCWEAGDMDGAPSWPCPTIQLLDGTAP